MLAAMRRYITRLGMNSQRALAARTPRVGLYFGVRAVREREDS